MSWSWNEPEAGDEASSYEEYEELDPSVAWQREFLNNHFIARNVEERASGQAWENDCVDFSLIVQDHSEDNSNWWSHCKNEYAPSNCGEILRESSDESNAQRASSNAFMDSNGDNDV